MCDSQPSGFRPGDARTEAEKVVGGWHSNIQSVIASTSDVYRHEVGDRPIRGLRAKGRVVLVGDAAHGMTPDLGQGSAQALLDAHQLAGLLSESPDVESALSAFARRQQRRTVPIVLQSRLAAWIGQLGGTSARVRNAVTRATPSRAFTAAFTAAY